MQTVTVTSSNIHQVGFDNEALFVAFKRGKTYRYEGVSRDTFDALAKAESPGKFFHQFIRDKYPAKAVEGDGYA